MKAKTLRRMLKKKGMKTTGKKATLMKRLHLKGGAEGGDPLEPPVGASGGTANITPSQAAALAAHQGGRRRRSRRSRRRE